MIRVFPAPGGSQTTSAAREKEVSLSMACCCQE
jgi:hypothetical protein